MGWFDRPVQLYRAKALARIRYSGAPGGTFSGWLWGTDVYSDNSMVCQAAVHAGLITFAKGGAFVVEIRPGQPSYRGSTRNGVTTSSYEAHPESFVFVK